MYEDLRQEFSAAREAIRKVRDTSKEREQAATIKTARLIIAHITQHPATKGKMEIGGTLVAFADLLQIRMLAETAGIRLEFEKARIPGAPLAVTWELAE